MCSHKTSLSRGRGFTLVELLVAIGVLMILLLLVSRIFFDATNAVATGVAMGDAMANDRVVSEQLKHDADLMLGPGGMQAGVRSRGFVGTPETGGILIIVNQESNSEVGLRLGQFGDEVYRKVRKDQLYFVRRGQGEVCMAPAAQNTFSNNNGAPYVLVSYLHAERTNDKLDFLASNWVLARHGLHLFEKDPPTIHANGAEYNAEVKGTSESGLRRHHGVTDAAYFSFDNADSDAGQAHGALVGAKAGNPANRNSTMLRADLGSGDYRNRAMQYTFATQPLKVNLTPEPYDRDDNDNTLQAWEVGQMHSVLTVGVSDFIVEFAADTDGSGNGPDKDGDKIRWYSMDNRPNFSGGGKTANEGNGYEPYGSNGGTHAWVFRHDDFGPDSYWPHMIRIRYRLHDGQGRLGEEADDDEDKPGRWFEHVIRVNRP